MYYIRTGCTMQALWSQQRYTSQNPPYEPAHARRAAADSENFLNSQHEELAQYHRHHQKHAFEDISRGAQHLPRSIGFGGIRSRNPINSSGRY